ncbi:MAG: threonine ammonia-lyase [Acidimicrobiales bacterium]|nr:threonine ammonia-lyase [Acidimicrobiales bacterium]
MTVDPTVSLDDVRAAAERIAGAVERTPSSRSHTLGELLGTDVVLKFENLQFTSSFKERGALNKLLTLSDAERACGVIAMSAGNHAQAVARHAARLGIDATIVMPAATPYVKVHGTEVLGARIVLLGEDLAEATTEAWRIAEAEGRVFVHPYDDAAVVAGQGTVALELLEAHPEIDALVVPTGGGGLLAGMAVVARALRPGLVLVGAQSDRWPSMVEACRGLTRRPAAAETQPAVEAGPTIAEGIAVPAAGRLTAALIRELVDELVTVRDESLEAAVNLLLDVEKVVVEGAGAAGLAALLEHRDLLRSRHQVGVVLSGGNIDPRLLASVVMRGLVRSGRLARLQIQVTDAPGSLGAVTTTLGRAGANIIELAHDRLFLDVPVRSAELEVVVETFDHEHLTRVLTALAEAGLPAHVAEVSLGHR